MGLKLPKRKSDIQSLAEGIEALAKQIGTEYYSVDIYLNYSYGKVEVLYKAYLSGYGWVGADSGKGCIEAMDRHIQNNMIQQVIHSYSPVDHE